MREKNGLSAEEAAAAWFVRLRDEPGAERHRAAFETWRDTDPAHAEAYREMERLWAGLDQLDRSPGGRNGVEKAQNTTTTPALPGRRRALYRMAAASAAVATGIGGYILISPGQSADHRTGMGEQREIILKDGSTAHLNSATAISTDFSADRRRITLHSGEAYFEVAKDAERPFIVEAAIGRVKSLGTAFSVRRTDSAVDVIVAESAVAVTGRQPDALVLSAGQHVRVTDSGLGEVANVDAKRKLAWRRGRLIFDNQPLGEVLADLERYRRGRIVVLDDKVGALPVTGSFAITDTDATLETIERTLPVRLYRLSDLLVLVDASKTP